VDKVEVRDAVVADVEAIQETLSHAFQRYKKYYTEEAYNITVCTLQEIERRIEDSETDVLVATCQGQIAGTATLHFKEQGRLYLSSMAVKPTAQGKGIGFYLLREAERRAKVKNCDVVSLECCEFLKMAIGLYKRMGYKRTGQKRPYYGVEVFEMQKLL
jgi:ribosomal-protein-alanine N-acetyltransferase